MATVTTLADANIVGDNEQQLVTMIVDNQLFGIPILQVQDIVEASKITPVPLAPSAIAGVLNLRGRIVTVIDLRKLMGNHDEVPWDSQMGVTVEYKGDLYTLLVDAIGDVRSLAKRDYDKTPSTMETEVKRLCSGIYRLRGNLLVVLDVGRILKAEVISATPMLTVEERKKRKTAAMQEATGEEGRARQLSALMNDLRAYEAENAEAQTLAGTGDASDDIKSRKRANRSRRPVADRWKEVLDERGRQQGKVVYRMREPDEEILEEARHMEQDSEAAESVEGGDALWQARVRPPEAADDQGVQPAKADTPAPATPDGDELTALSDLPGDPEEIAPLGEDGAPTQHGEDGESPGVFSGWWNKLRGKDDGEPEAEMPEPGAEDKPTAEVSPPQDELVAADDTAETDIGDKVKDEAGDDEPKSDKAASKSAKSTKSSSKAKPAAKGKKK